MEMKTSWTRLVWTMKAMNIQLKTKTLLVWMIGHVLSERNMILKERQTKFEMAGSHEGRLDMAEDVDRWNAYLSQLPGIASTTVSSTS